MSQEQQADETAGRTRLNRPRVLAAAIQLADSSGLAAVSMRGLGTHLGVEAMALYNHVANKDDLLDAMVEVVVDELNGAVADHELPDSPDQWAAALRRRSLAARQVMLRHRWAPAALQQRAAISPAVARYYDGVAAILMAGGFDMDLTHHAMHVLGSVALGFSQELFTPGDGAEEASTDLASIADQIPHLVAMLAAVSHDDPDSRIGWCDDQSEFEFGLDVLIDGLERRRPDGSGRSPRTESSSPDTS